MALYNSSLYNTVLYGQQTIHIVDVSDTVTTTDVKFKELHRVFPEVAVKVDDLTKQLTGKGLFDTVRLADWATIKRNPAQINWSDD